MTPCARGSVPHPGPSRAFSEADPGPLLAARARPESPAAIRSAEGARLYSIAIVERETSGRRAWPEAQARPPAERHADPGDRGHRVLLFLPRLLHRRPTTNGHVPPSGASSS